MDTIILLKIGEVMPDGSIYAGISPDTNAPMYTTPRDAFDQMNWHEAVVYAKDLIAYGHRDWRLPTAAELDVLFINRAAIGNFDGTGEPPSGWYWSATDYLYFEARDQRFSDGYQGINMKTLDSSVRCVRHT